MNECSVFPCQGHTVDVYYSPFVLGRHTLWHAQGCQLILCLPQIALAVPPAGVPLLAPSDCGLSSVPQPLGSKLGLLLLAVLLLALIGAESCGQGRVEEALVLRLLLRLRIHLPRHAAHVRRPRRAFLHRAV